MKSYALRVVDAHTELVRLQELVKLAEKKYEAEEKNFCANRNRLHMQTTYKFVCGEYIITVGDGGGHIDSVRHAVIL